MIRAGRHLVRVEVPGKGYSDKSWWGIVQLAASGSSPSIIPAGGGLMIFSGFGIDN